MLLRLYLKNIYSFSESTQFNMLVNPKRKNFPEHVYKELPIPVVKMASIYGANGAGKTNIIKAVKLLEKIVVSSKGIKSFDNYKFKLDKDSIDNNLVIGIDFIKNGQVYFYYIKATKDTIIEEGLSFIEVETNERRPIYKRYSRDNSHFLKEFKMDGIDFPEIDITENINKSQNRSRSILNLHNEWSILSHIEKETFDDVFSWFESDLIVIDANTSFGPIIANLDKNKDLYKFSNENILNFDLGVENIGIVKKPIQDFIKEKGGIFSDKFLSDLADDNNEDARISLRNKNAPIAILSKENGEPISTELEFINIGKNGYKGNLSVEEQSLGTIALLERFPLIHLAINKEKVILVDEIEISMHPLVIKKLIQLFGDNKNTKGQLIFTTHQCILLDQQDMMRPDEVWFVQKDNGESKIYSLNDFKEHNTIDIQRGYLAGRYGAIPYFGGQNSLDESTKGM